MVEDKLLISVVQLGGMVSVVIALCTWIFSRVVDGKITKFQVSMIEKYATKTETASFVPRLEYDLRHSELMRDVGKLEETIREMDQRILAVRNLLDTRRHTEGELRTRKDDDE